MTIDIKKHFEKKVMIDYFFIQGTIDVNVNYFINKIEEGLKRDDNMSFKTNVKDQMTSYTYFNDDEEFGKIVSQFITYVDRNMSLRKYCLLDSWGIKCNLSGETLEHDHLPSLWSGVLYLNSHKQVLNFPEINQSVKPEKGSFALFSSFLKHKTSINETKEIKYGLSFNFRPINN
tara:strand:- start:2127 stop:2651 length:525 start_codon:yes stop_codon:yes gene_type:complete